MFALTTTIKKLTAKLALAVMLTGMLSPLHAVADGNTGLLMIRVDPAQGTYQVLDETTGLVALSRRSGDTNIAGFPAGDYRITYEDIASYTKPVDQLFSMVPGGSITLYGNYLPVTHSGILNVVVSPAAGKYEIKDNATGVVVAVERTGSQSFVLPFGDYLVDFKDLNGFQTPADQTLSLDAGHLNVTATGHYEAYSMTGTVSVTVSPATGKYDIKDNVTGAVVATETVGSKSFVLPFGDYLVDFKDIGGGYQAPADQALSLNAQSPLISIVGYYQFETLSGTLNVVVSPAAGRYEVKDNVTGAIVAAETSGNHSFTLPFGDYLVDFKDLAGYIAPADQALSLNAQSRSVTVTGNYTTQANTGTIAIQVVDQNNQPITDGLWELRSCTGATLDSCNTAVANGNQGATLYNQNAGSYGLFAQLTPAYSARVILGANPGTLAATQTLSFTIVYTPKEIVNTLAGIQITTQPIAGGIRVNGQTLGAPSAAGTFIPTPAFQVNVTQANTISFDAVAGYNAPADIVIPAGSLTAGDTTQYTGTYQLISSHAAILSMTTTPVAGEIFVNGNSVGTPANAGDLITLRVANPGDFVVSFGAVANYTKPADQTISVTQAQIDGDATIPVSGTYTPINTSADTATLSITTSVANAPVSVDGTLVGNAGPTTPVTKVVAINAAHTISFGDVANYVKPTDINIPANTLEKDKTKDYNGVYEPATALTITKTATEEAVVNNNKLVHYTITITRQSEANVMANNRATVRDTVTGVGKITSGGGELNVVPNTCKVDGTQTSTCVDLMAIELLFDIKGSQHTITYDMRSNNAAQPVAANFTNTISATYHNPISNQDETASANHIVSVAAAPANNQPSGSSSGSSGGSGVGGGHAPIKGDMNLTIQKLVSIDGSTFKNALGENNAFAIPENKATRLTFKVVITNPSDLSARNLRFKHSFDEGKSDMTADALQNLVGATLDIRGNILVDKVKVGETASFTYNVLVHENGQNVNPGIDGLEVIEIDSFLPDVQDFLTYKNLGQNIDSYLYAGRVPAGKTTPQTPSAPKGAFGNVSDVLSVRVLSDKAQAMIGETVNITLILQNVGEEDLTNLYLSHLYPAELDIVNAGGAKDDGRELQWKSPILRPGETIAKRFSAKVVAGAPGSQIHSLTRAMVDQAENVAPVDSYLTIIGGTPATTASAYRLVQTGPGMTLILFALSALIALGITTRRRKSVAIPERI